MGQAWFCTLPPACVFVFCLHRHSLPPARVLCFIRRTSVYTASCIMQDTALRAPCITQQRRQREQRASSTRCSMADTRWPRSRSRWVLGLRLLLLLLCPVFCLINTLPPPACVFVFCLHRHSLPPARVLCLVPFTGPPHGKKMRPWACVLCRPPPELPFHSVWFLGWSTWYLALDPSSVLYPPPQLVHSEVAGGGGLRPVSACVCALAAARWITTHVPFRFCVHVS
jgi:hypothetical protein